MEKYKRLTERVGKGISVKETSTNDNKSIWNAIQRLAELEDKIENGTLIELPCKINDIVYQVCEKLNTNPFVKVPRELFIIEHKVGDIKMSMIRTKPIFRILTFNEEFGTMAWSGEHIGTQLFLTPAEAEKKLKERQDG